MKFGASLVVLLISSPLAESFSVESLPASTSIIDHKCRGPSHFSKSDRSASSCLAHAEKDASPDTSNKETVIDRRPHEQRVKRPRKARRLNHSFMHLYRHDSSRFDDEKIAPSSKSMTSPRIYLKEYAGFMDHEIDTMSESFPPLLDLDVKRHLRPKLRFLKYTLQGLAADSNLTSESKGPLILSKIAKRVPPQYFGSRMEKVVAPKHAFLMHMGLPHGKALLDNDAELFRDFLLSCRRTNTFAALCNEWRRAYGKCEDEGYQHLLMEEGIEIIPSDRPNELITPKKIDAFDGLFARGILAASRNDMDPQNQHLQHMNVTASQMIYLLTKHGSNPLERDVRDISLLHWSAGAGELGSLRQLIAALPGGMEEAVRLRADRDGASILHWAAAGSEAKAFGCGGHINVCKYLMENCGGPSAQKEVVNGLTKDGNSILMWAAWSGSLDVVKLVVRHRADPLVKNRNGCTVAHWACSGGNLELCKYLEEVMDLDFTEGNNAGNTPLSHAIAYGRLDVAQWLREDIKVEDDGRARALAESLYNFDSVSEGDERKKAFDLFNTEWYDE